MFKPLHTYFLFLLLTSNLPLMVLPFVEEGEKTTDSRQRSESSFLNTFKKTWAEWRKKTSENKVSTPKNAEARALINYKPEEDTKKIRPKITKPEYQSPIQKAKENITNIQKQELNNDPKKLKKFLNDLSFVSEKNEINDALKNNLINKIKNIETTILGDVIRGDWKSIGKQRFGLGVNIQKLPDFFVDALTKNQAEAILEQTKNKASFRNHLSDYFTEQQIESLKNKAEINQDTNDNLEDQTGYGAIV